MVKYRELMCLQIVMTLVVVLCLRTVAAQEPTVPATAGTMVQLDPRNDDTLANGHVFFNVTAVERLQDELAAVS